MEDNTNQKEVRKKESIIILGKGKGYKTLPGNKVYRRLINKYKDEYKSITGNNKRKCQIAKEIIKSLHNQGKFFCEEDKDSGLIIPTKFCNENDVCDQKQPLTGKKVLETVKQALRDSKPSMNTQKDEYNMEAQEALEDEEDNNATHREKERMEGSITMHGKKMRAIVWDLARLTKEFNNSVMEGSLHNCPYLSRYGIRCRVSSLRGILLRNDDDHRKDSGAKDSMYIDNQASTMSTYGSEKNLGAEIHSNSCPYSTLSGNECMFMGASKPNSMCNHNDLQTSPREEDDDDEDDFLYHMAKLIEESPSHSEKANIFINTKEAMEENPPITHGDQLTSTTTSFYDYNEEEGQGEKDAVNGTDAKRHKTESEEVYSHIQSSLKAFAHSDVFSTTDDHNIMKRTTFDDFPEDEFDLEPTAIQFPQEQKKENSHFQDLYATFNVPRISDECPHAYQGNVATAAAVQMNPNHHENTTTFGRDHVDFLDFIDNENRLSYTTVGHSQIAPSNARRPIIRANRLTPSPTTRVKDSLQSLSLSDDSNSSNDRQRTE